MKLDIQLVEEPADYWAVEEISRAAWGLDDYHEVIPAHLMITFQQNGGLLLGAWLDGKLVGFSIGFIGLTGDGTATNGRVKFCSEQLGVLPEYQSYNIGYRMKLAQREHLLARGINHATWTYDPLETKNGNLNLHKLGAVCNIYYVNLYGTAAGINAGLPTDRFQVDWWLDSPQVNGRLQGTMVDTLDNLRDSGVPVINPAQGIPHPRPGGAIIPPHHDRLLMQVPASIRTLKQEDPELALTWRLHTRELFVSLFAQGYKATDLLHTPDACYYLLEAMLAL